MDDHKKVIDEFKQENGNNSFTGKEMMILALAKIDKQDAKLDDIVSKLNIGAGKIGVNSARIDANAETNDRSNSWTRKLMFFGFGILGTVIGFIFVSVINIYEIIGG